MEEKTAVKKSVSKQVTVKDLAGKVKAVPERAEVDNSKDIDSLTAKVKRLEKVLEEERGKASKDAETVKEAKSEFKRANDALTEKVAELGNVSKELDTAKKELGAWEESYKEDQKKLEALSKELEELKKKSATPQS